jgi:hypothetical protein
MTPEPSTSTWPSRFLLKAALVVACAGCSVASPALRADDPSPVQPIDGLRVFVMGHSFHAFVADRLTPLAKSAGIVGHELVGRQMIGGSSVRQHWNLPDGQNRAKAALVAGEVPGITRQSELFTDAIGHGTAPILALVTYCNFACLYGRSPVGLDDGDRQLDRIHPQLRPVLQRIAWDAVTAHPLSGVTNEGRAETPARKQPVE